MTNAGEKLLFHQVDVFASAGFAGNPVAVVHDASQLSRMQMQTIANWTNLSETTFLGPPSDGSADYSVRIFTPFSELPFAGHPTLGTCRAWLEAGGHSQNPDEIVQECPAGLVPLRREGSKLAFAAPPMIRSGVPTDDERARALGLLGLSESQAVDVAWVDNGPGWIAVLVHDAETVLRIEPVPIDREPADVVAVGPHPPGAECAVELRAFFGERADSITEDPVTGSANASVAQWLTDTGRLSLPYVAAQGTRLGRAGRVYLSGEVDGDIWVGGETTIQISGTIRV